MKKRMFLIGLIFIFLNCSIVFATSDEVKEDFDLNSLLVKVSLHTGEQVSRAVTISSVSGGDFDFKVVGVPGITLSDNKVSLQPGETKSIMASFDTSGVKEGVYTGHIEITGKEKVENLPVIFEIESEDVFFDLNIDIPPQYASISPGQKVIAQVKVFDLTSGGTSDGLGPTRVNVEYYIYDIDGNAVSSQSENIVVDKQVQVTQSINFPENAKVGEYVFFAVVKYQSSIGVASHIFSVIPSSKGLLSGVISDSVDIKFFVILGAIVLIFFAMMFFFVYLLKDRDKLIIDLKKYNDYELRRQMHLLGEQEKILKKKKVPTVIIKREIIKKVEKLKKKQSERVKHVEVLKRKGNRNEMKRKINEWKKEGYNIAPMEYKMKGLSESEMRSILNKWRDKYLGERRV